MNWWYWFGRLLISRLMRTFGRVEVVGMENIPPFGPLIVTPNHLNNADPPLLAAVFNRPLFFMGKRNLFINRFVSYFLRGWHVYPVNRDGRDVSSVRWALQLLDRDGALVLFPEGARNPGRLVEATDGATYLALRSQAPILPVAITGTEGIPSYPRMAFPLRRMRVVIGQPYTLPHIEGRVARPVLRSLTTQIMQRIAVLLPPEYRGVYQETTASR